MMFYLVGSLCPDVLGVSDSFCSSAGRSAGIAGSGDAVEGVLVSLSAPLFWLC